MATAELSYLLGINSKFLSKNEKILFEADLLIKVCHELKSIFREKYKIHFQLMKLSTEKEEEMVEMHYICWAIKDILLTGEYNLSGIAYYTQTPEEVIFDLMTGSNTRPSATFLQHVIALHQQVKQELYLSIRKKIVDQYFAAAS